MDNTSVKNEELGNVELYKNQLKYDKYVIRKKKIYSYMYLAASVVSLLAMFLFPIFKYAVKGNSRKNIQAIEGEYTPIYIIQKFFANELGSRSILNTLLIVSIVLMIIISVYMVIGSVMNLFLKKLVVSSKLIGKLFGYGMLEIVSTIFLVLLFAAMVFCRVDVSGGAENIIGFWTLFLTSVIMICTSIPLSTK